MTDIYNAFQKRVVEIETGLGLTAPFYYKKIDDYQETTKAYILLVHAEIEKYFEIMSAKIIYDSLELYNKCHLANRPLSSLLSTNLYTVNKPESFNEKRTDYIVDADPDNRVNKFFTKYVSEIKNNNGIKSDNVFSLLWKLGFKKDDVGTDLLLLLDSYGSKRGYIAHTGDCPNKKLLNYEEEKVLVSQLSVELKKLDEYIDSSNFLDSSTDISKVSSILYV